MSLVLVTGADGFIGRHVVGLLRAEGRQVRRAVWRVAAPEIAGDTVAIDSIGPSTEWRPALEGVDAVVHLAARVHITKETSQSPLEAFRDVNTLGTKRLALACIEMGVRRMVYVSSIKVNGDATTRERPFTPADSPFPEGPYAVSKAEAESALRRIADASNLEIAIVRPVLTYGAGVVANFLQLLRFVDKGIPLPFAGIENLRDMAYAGNLAGLLVRCVWHPGACNATFLASDGRPLSTPDWIRCIAHALGRNARLFRFPAGVLRILARVAAQEGAMERLYGSLRVDAGPAKSLLGWKPPYTVEEGLEKTARWYLDGRQSQPLRVSPAPLR